MKKAKLNGAELAFDVSGLGDPLLLIGTGPLCDSFLPLMWEPALAGRYQMIRYHQRGQGESSRSSTPISIEEHASDAAALLGHLEITRAHIAGHSSGGDIALQLAGDRPDLVHTLLLFEPALMAVPSAPAFAEEVGPAVAAYESGDRERAMALFMSVVCGLEWKRCRAVIDERIPGGVARVIEDADSFFTSYLPSLGAWPFSEAEASKIEAPVLSILGTNTHRLFVEGHELLQRWFPGSFTCTIDGAGHLLHIERPEAVARAVREFAGSHPVRIAAGR